ncbi:MAG: sensor histidine kinase [Oscillospiraceae bacterium]
MKINLKRRLQFRFVLLSLTALIILQSLIVSFSIFRNYQQINIRADHIIMLTSKSPDSPELIGAEYFFVEYYLKDKTFRTDLTHTSSVTESSAIGYAKTIIEKKTDKGYTDDFRYLVRRKKGSIQIVFLSRSASLEAFRNNRETLILISIIGIGVMAVLLVIVSGKVVEPIVRNHEKQKEFITSASHELKTPLTIIHADAQLLESDIGENEWLSDIIKQTERMTEMTHRLVYLSRVEEQDGNFVKIDFPISDLAEEITQSYRAVAQNQGKTYSVDIQKELTCCGDEKAIRELMTALLDNAFKYSTADGHIGVKLCYERHEIIYSVENTVSDIDNTRIKKFTERFYRADTSDKVKGFGIGLSIARAVAEGHKGKLSVELSDDIITISAILKKR